MIESSTEKEKKPAHQLWITIHRHGPKASSSGPLSPEGKQLTKQYFDDAYSGVPASIMQEGVSLEYSPIQRAEETVNIYQIFLAKNGVKVKDRKPDERLSEGTITSREHVIEQLGGYGGLWVEKWLQTDKGEIQGLKTGKEAVAGFCSWLLEKVSQTRTSQTDAEVDAFSHGALILAFMLKLQEKLGQNIVPEDWKERKILDNTLGYLSYINFSFNPDSPEVLVFRFAGQNIEIPIKILKDLAGQ